LWGESFSTELPLGVQKSFRATESESTPLKRIMLIPPSPVGVAMAAMVSLIVRLGKAGSGYKKDHPHTRIE
jgi:hypothetical protein